MTTPDYRALCAELVEQLQRAISEHGFCLEAEDALMYRARTDLAQSEPERPTDEEMEEAPFLYAPEWYNNEMAAAWEAGRSSGWRDALARWGRPAIKPVPVSERPWEREKGWNDLDGECWWCPPDGPLYWQMANPAMVYGGWLLPAHALPVPEVTP